MKKNKRYVPLADIHTFQLNSQVEEPLYRQVYSSIREEILQGQLSPGVKLPSSRALAQKMGVSRNTVVNAYEQLWAEGFIEGKTGSGSYVSENLPPRLLFPPGSKPNEISSSEERPKKLSQRGRQMKELRPRIPVARPLPFCPGMPELGEFPMELWARIVARHWKRASHTMLAYGSPAGYLPLRQAISEYLQACRGVRCQAEQIIIVAGAQQALDLLARMLLDPGDHVWVEDPGYQGAKGAFMAAGAEIIPIPVDSEGLNPEKAKHSSQARLAYLTPSHQYPTGVTMSLSRRLEMIAWAQEKNAWIIEDDYDSEYRYVGSPLASMQGLDTTGRVFYIGTFSKVLFPSLRIGYLVVPSDLVEDFIHGRSLLDSHAPTLIQAALTTFIEKGYFASHIRRMRTLYEERQKLFVQELEKKLSTEFNLSHQAAGMHLVAYAKNDFADQDFAPWVRERGMELSALSSYYYGKEKKSGLVLGYAGFNLPQIEEGVEKLSRLYEDFCKL